MPIKEIIREQMSSVCIYDSPKCIYTLPCEKYANHLSCFAHHQIRDALRMEIANRTNQEKL